MGRQDLRVNLQTGDPGEMTIMRYKIGPILSMALISVFLLSSCAKKELKPPPPPPAPPSIEEKPLKLPEIREEPRKEEERREKTVLKRTGEPVRVEATEEEKYIVLNFDEADIKTVISTIGELLGINYILSPGISGKVTIQSYKRFPYRDLFQIFQTILELNGLTAVKEGPLYKIVPIATAKQETTEVQKGREVEMVLDSSFITQIIPLEYVKASDAASILRGLMPRGSDLIVYEPTNLLIVTARPQGLIKIMKILEAVDIPPSDRESIRTFVYYVENGEAKKLAQVLKEIYVKGKKKTPRTVRRQQFLPPPRRKKPESISPTIVGALPAEVRGEITITAYEDINAIIIKASPSDYLTILQTLKKLDIPPKQVLIEVLIGEITLTDTTRYGLEWLLKKFGSPTVTIENVNIGKGGLFGSTETGILPQQSSGFSTIVSGVLNAAQVNAIINFLVSRGALNVLASPHILALDNKEAKIEIGDEIPIATGLTQQPATGTGATTLVSTGQIQYRTAGIILTVTPHISEKGKVTLKISQEFSSPGQTYKVADQDFQGFITRRAQTTGVVQDGHSMLIGGLISTKKTRTRSGIPVLSNIPILGSLFSTTNEEEVKTELIVMVTPHLIRSEEDIDKIVKDFQNRVKTIKREIEKRKKPIDEPTDNNIK